MEDSQTWLLTGINVKNNEIFITSDNKYIFYNPAIPPKKLEIIHLNQDVLGWCQFKNTHVLCTKKHIIYLYKEKYLIFNPRLEGYRETIEEHHRPIENWEIEVLSQLIPQINKKKEKQPFPFGNADQAYQMWKMRKNEIFLLGLNFVASIDNDKFITFGMEYTDNGKEVVTRKYNV